MQDHKFLQTEPKLLTNDLITSLFIKFFSSYFQFVHQQTLRIFIFNLNFVCRCVFFLNYIQQNQLKSIIFVFILLIEFLCWNSFFLHQSKEFDWTESHLKSNWNFCLIAFSKKLFIISNIHMYTAQNTHFNATRHRLIFFFASIFIILLFNLQGEPTIHSFKTCSSLVDWISKVQRNYNFPVHVTSLAFEHIFYFSFLLLFYRAVSSVGFRIQSKINCRITQSKLWFYASHIQKITFFCRNHTVTKSIKCDEIRAFINHPFDSVPRIVVLLSLCYTFLVRETVDASYFQFSFCFTN